MTESSSPDPAPASTRYEALIVWVKLVALLAGLSAFGGAIYFLSRMINASG